MAKGRKTGGKDIQKGEVRNPGGPPKGLTELRRYGAKELAEKMHALMKCTLAELATEVVNPEADALTVALARIMIKAAEMGDLQKINFIIERVAGPVVKKIELSGQVNTLPVHNLENLTDEELRTMGSILKKATPTKEEE